VNSTYTKHHTEDTSKGRQKQNNLTKKNCKRYMQTDSYWRNAYLITFF